MSAGGGCESAVTARPTCGWLMFRECSELMYGRRFPLRLKTAVYKSYVRPAILCGSEVWCLLESEMGILPRTERSMVRAMCVVQLNDRNRYTDLKFNLGLMESMYQLAMANSVCWYGHVLRRDGGHVLRRALGSEVEGQRKNGRPKKTLKKQVEEESMKVGLRREDVLCRSKGNDSVNQIAAGWR